MSIEFVHFDQIEDELERIMREMLSQYAKIDPSVSMSEQASQGEKLADVAALEFIKHLQTLGVEHDVAMILDHFRTVILEYDRVDMVVAAKVEDQTPEIGVNALISEHKVPIMQDLQERDEGYSG